MQVLLSLYHDYMMAIFVLILFVDFDHTCLLSWLHPPFLWQQRSRRRRRHKSADQEWIIVMTFLLFIHQSFFFLELHSQPLFLFVDNFTFWTQLLSNQGDQISFAKNLSKELNSMSCISIVLLFLSFSNNFIVVGFAYQVLGFLNLPMTSL